jgi:hypothetical protein
METFGLLVILGAIAAIAGGIAFIFIRKRHYEQGVVVFLSIMIIPPLLFYFGKWLSEDLLYDLFYNLPSGFTDMFPGLLMTAAFAYACIYWARRGQSLEEKSGVSAPATSPAPQAKPPPTPDAGNTAVRARLVALEDLKRDGLVTEAEYAEKRAAILSEI